MTSLKQHAIKYIISNLSKNMWVRFSNDAFTFYDDTCGQRQHKVEQYVAYGHKVKNHLKVTRVLSFTNEVDEGKDGAVLGIINLEALTLVAVHEDKVEFTLLTIHFK